MARGFHERSMATASILFIVILSLNAFNLQGVQAQNQLSATFSVSYQQGYTKIAGTVTDINQSPVEGAIVSIQAIDPAGETVHFDMVYTDQIGRFTDEFKTPEVFNGEGTIYVSASKAGYEKGSTQANFTAIPEFSTTIMATFMSMLLALTLLKRKIAG